MTPQDDALSSAAPRGSVAGVVVAAAVDLTFGIAPVDAGAASGVAVFFVVFFFFFFVVTVVVSALTGGAGALAAFSGLGCFGLLKATRLPSAI